LVERDAEQECAEEAGAKADAAISGRTRFARDSLLEEGGFEPSVPLRVDTDAERSEPGLTDEDDMRVRPL
jgi:hypothetical protein